MPGLARRHFHHPGVGGFLHQAAPTQLHLQHRGFHIAREHHIAAPAQHKHRLARAHGGVVPIHQILQAAHAHQGFGTGHDAKAVVGL